MMIMATIENYDDERFITLLVRDRGQVEEERSDKPDSELKKLCRVPAQCSPTHPRQIADVLRAAVDWSYVVIQSRRQAQRSHNAVRIAYLLAELPGFLECRVFTSTALQRVIHFHLKRVKEVFVLLQEPLWHAGQTRS